MLNYYNKLSICLSISWAELPAVLLVQFYLLFITLKRNTEGVRDNNINFVCITNIMVENCIGINNVIK